MLNKPDVKGYVPIYLIAYYSGEKFRFFTKIKVQPRFFNNKKEEFRSSMPKHEDYNFRLASMKFKLEQYYLDYQEKYNATPTNEELKKAMSYSGNKNKSLEEVFVEFLEYAHKNRAANTVKNYISFFNHIKKFQTHKKSKLFLSDFNQKAIHGFEYYLKESGLKENGVYTIMKSFKAFVKYCDKYQNIILHHDLSKIKPEYKRVRKIFLTMEQVKAIESLKFEYENLTRIRDCFLFMCYTGIAYVDASKLKAENFVKIYDYDVIKFRRQKTLNKNEFDVEVVAGRKIKAIIQKYQGGKTLLPFISNQKMNSHLKTIAEKAGIDLVVSTHTARHTYASLALMKGLEPEVIASNMGLASTKELKTYMKMTDIFKHRASLGLWDD